MYHFRKKVVRIATFNLFNLVSAGRTFYENRKYTQSEYAKKIQWIAFELNQMKADIVGFQEVFHKEALEEAVNASGLYLDYNLIVANETGLLPRVGILSKYPILEHKIYENYPENSQIKILNESTNEQAEIPFRKFSRPVLKAKIRVAPKLDLYVFVVHLKSKRPVFLEGESRDNPVDLAKAQARSLIIRASEAAAVRSLLMETMQHKKHPVVLLGDVNDTGLSVTTKMISGEAPHRNMKAEEKKRIWDVLLYHVKDIQARRSYNDFYYTHIHNGHYESLDHIMVSEELVAENPYSIGKIGYVRLFNDHLIDRTLTNEKIKPWKSDHGLVVATIELNMDKIKKM